MKNGETYWGSVEAVLTIDFFSCKICVVALGLHMYDIASAQATCVHSTQQPCGTWQVLWDTVSVWAIGFLSGTSRSSI